MNEFELLRSLRDLPREREPARDLWPGIAARIATPAMTGTAPARAPRRAWLALAASLLLGAVLAPLLWNPGPAPDLATTPAPVASAPQPRGLQPEADAMTLEYVAALDQLGGPQLPPALAPALSELDLSATQIRAALRQDPSATYLLAQLRRTYEQRLRLTQLALSGPSMRTS